MLKAGKFVQGSFRKNVLPRKNTEIRRVEIDINLECVQYLTCSIFNGHTVYLKIYMQANVQILSVELPGFYVYTCAATTQMNMENLHHFRKFSLLSITSSCSSQRNHLNCRQQD